MIKDVIGYAISVIVIFIELMITPTYYVGLVQWARASTQTLAYTRNLVDEVIDNRELTEAMMADYNIQMASVSGYYVATIRREVKVTNPKPGGVAGETYSTYVVVDDIKHYNQGDKVVVTVEQVGSNVFQSIANFMFGFAVANDGFTLPGRVR